MTTMRSVLVVLAVSVGFHATRADAQEVERPWAKGVGKEQQQKALALFTEGNALLKEGIFPRAADRYREATKQWEHPGIYFNLALALLNLDNPVEVHAALQKAMAYGEAPLDKEKFQHAKTYLALIEKQLAKLEITCPEPGAVVSMDGKELFRAPGKWEGLVRSGPHSIVATKDGFAPSEYSKALPSGQVIKIDLKLYTTQDLVRYRRKWDVWKPWAVVGAGAAFVIAGGLFSWQSGSAFSDYDAAIVACGGCVPSDEVNGKKSSGEMFKTISMVGFGVGAAALITGAILVYINRAEEYRINPLDRDAVTVFVSPLLGPGVGGAVVTLKF